MATSLSAASHSSRPETGELWSRIAWCLLGAVLVGYGMMAFQSGTKISPLRTEGSEAAATVERIMQRPNNAAREQALSREIRGLLDLEELSRRALGDHWGSLSEAQRQEFVELLRQLVERSYRSNLDRTLRYQVDYQNAEARGGTVHVRTEARNTRNRREPPVRIEYDMHQRGGEWRVFDLTIDDGLSMVTNYRRQFDRIIEREGFEGLLGKMRERLEAGGS